MTTLEITIPVASTWPTREELMARNAVEDDLIAAGIGEFVGAGGGQGQMDICFQVRDELAAHAVVEAAMKKHFPGIKYVVGIV